MRKRKLINNLFNCIYIIIVLLFISDWFLNFEIKNEGLKLFVLYGTLFLTVPILIWNYIVLRPRFISTAIPIIMLILIFVIGPTKILFSVSVWKTQTILFENGHLKFMTIEHQTKDIGALGYKDRMVQVTNIASLFMIINEVPNNIDAKNEWVEVNRYINQQKLKNP